jgi:hypothetical protein
MQVKLDELIRVVDGAQQALLDLEEFDDERGPAPVSQACGEGARRDFVGSLRSRR